jgi:L-2-hydroxyglutarate oxidase LhgO
MVALLGLQGRFKQRIMTDQLDVVVIGAGVIGLAVARSLAMAGRDVVVLEAEPHIGMHTSSRNSEVIHAGIYYPQNSLKARLCVAGKEMLYRYCEEHHIDHQAIGKLIVASGDEDLGKLHAIAEQARQNGVMDLQFLDEPEIAGLEPNVVCGKGLLSPSTGIVDSHSLMMAMQADIEANNGVVVCNSEVGGIGAVSDGFVLEMVGGDGDRFGCRMLVNAGGLWAQGVAASIGGEVSGDRGHGPLLQGRDRGHGPLLQGGDRGVSIETDCQSKTAQFERLGPLLQGGDRGHGPLLQVGNSGGVMGVYFAKAHYFSYQGTSPFQHLIYPLPSDGGLGIHATNDLSGATRFGPDVTWVDEVDYGFDESRKVDFVGAIRSYFPGLDEERLVPAYTGIRPKLVGAGVPAVDFVIQGEADHGVPGLVNLFGIESPGLTASLAIGEHVRGILL